MLFKAPKACSCWLCYMSISHLCTVFKDQAIKQFLFFILKPVHLLFFSCQDLWVCCCEGKCGCSSAYVLTIVSRLILQYFLFYNNINKIFDNMDTFIGTTNISTGKNVQIQERSFYSSQCIS